MHSEFALIRQYFQQATAQRADVALGIGDDCALLKLPAGQQLAVSMDTLVSGRHFIAEVAPDSLGHKVLAVNLSDMAAMGAEPAWATLALTLPGADQHWLNWLQNFMQGFSTLARQHQIQLIGGDTTRGPLSITVQIHGFVPENQALRRDAAKPGDWLYVSGTVGDAGLALQRQQQNQTHTQADDLFARLNKPTPRIQLGLGLRDVANAAIDISDGLVADLGHICTNSDVGAKIHIADIPLSTALKAHISAKNDWRLPLNAGDDYELLFTVPEKKTQLVEQIAAESHTAVTCIGKIHADKTIQLIQPDGKALAGIGRGYDHFAH